MPLFDSLAEALTLLRRVRGLSLDQIAETTGTARSDLEAFEAGERRPDLATLDRLLDAFDAQLEHLQWALDRERLQETGGSGHGRGHENHQHPDLPYPIIGPTDDEICEPGAIYQPEPVSVAA